METNPLQEREKEKPVHYLERDDIRQVIQENWPEIMPLLKDVTYPKESSRPDALESWEVRKRLERVDTLSEHSPLYALHMLLYEECFGVNSTPGINEKFRDSLAPTPGGMLSHGHPMNIVDGASLEAVAQYDFSGDTAKGAAASISDFVLRERFYSLIAETLYPTGIGASYMNSHLNQATRRSLFIPGAKTKEEVDTWGYRLIRLVKTQGWYKNFDDQHLKDLAGIDQKMAVSFAQFWTLLWRKMSRDLTSDGGFRDSDDPSVKKAIGTLLKVRVDPAVKNLFEYHSPSGYLNELDVQEAL